MTKSRQATAGDIAVCLLAQAAGLLTSTATPVEVKATGNGG
ncbi:hypothetical protein [Mycobacterium uberis]|nr:hypothetical protein [Mycobacterium uberis]